MIRVIQGLLGACLAIAFLFGSGVLAARYFMTRLTTLPPRPTFAEEAPEDAPAPPAAPETGDVAEPTATPEAPPAEDNPADNPNAYQARVVQPIGLILREGPDVSTTQLGGIDYNEEVTIISESEDGQWVQVQLLGSEVIGWVKAGNTERLE